MNAANVQPAGKSYVTNAFNGILKVRMEINLPFIILPDIVWKHRELVQLESLLENVAIDLQVDRVKTQYQCCQTMQLSKAKSNRKCCQEQWRSGIINRLMAVE